MTAPTEQQTQRVAMEDVQDVYGAQLADLHHRVAGLTLENRALQRELDTLRQQHQAAQRGGNPSTFAPPAGQTVEGAPAV